MKEKLISAMVGFIVEALPGMIGSKRFLCAAVANLVLYFAMPTLEGDVAYAATGWMAVAYTLPWLMVIHGYSQRDPEVKGNGSQ